MKTTRISAWVAAGLVVGTALFTACSKSDDTPSLPPIGGYNSSNEVAASALQARWSFEGNQNELVSNTAPTKTYGTVNYVAGVGGGQALNVVDGAVVYPSIAKIGAANSLASYTVSMWVNVKNNKNTKNAFTTFFGIFPTDTKDAFGNLSGSAETAWFNESTSADTLVLKANYKSLLANGSFNGQDNRPDPRGKPPVGVFKGTGVWSHFVMRFDPATHKLMIFANGESIGAYDDRGANTVELNMMTPCQAVIGSLAGKEIGFASADVLPSFTKLGTFAIDNIRVFNKPLSEADIKALYQLELAGR